MVPTVSVVITCYNYGEYLAGCLESVLAQTYIDYEIIVVDDGSTDNTSEVIKPYLEYSNVRYIFQENGGQANAKNRGIAESKGEFIAFLDADDLWEQDKLQKQMKLFHNSEVGVVYSCAKLVDSDGKGKKSFPQSKSLQPKAGKVTESLFLDNFVWFSSSVVRKECFSKCGQFDESLQMGIDWDLWLRISTQYTFDFVAQSLLLYRIGHSGQMSHNIETRYNCAERIMKSFLMAFPNTVSDRVVKYAYFTTYCNRGKLYRKINRKLSYKYFIKAISLRPFYFLTYYEIVRNLFI